MRDGETDVGKRPYRNLAPYLPTNLPLLRLEPIMRKEAEARNPGKVLFSHNVTGYEDKGDHVIVSYEDDKGVAKTLKTQYLVGADGGKTVGKILGVKMEGVTNIRRVVSAHFKADLSQVWDDRTGIAHFANPEYGMGMRGGSLLPHGPTWGRHSEEWQMHFAIPFGDPMLPKAEFESRIRSLLKLPDLKVELISSSEWIMERVLADKYQQGRVFIGGDSAHRHPPTTGLGLNTAVQDAHNLAWKLASVIHGTAAPTLLDTYQPERLPIGRRNCDWAAFTGRCHRLITAALGLVEDDAEANKAHVANLLSDTDIGRAMRAHLQYVIDGQAVEFHAHDMDLGFSYENGALVPDGSEAPYTDARHQVYTPSTRPGHRLPHAWVENKGKTLATQDLLGKNGDFLLITDHDGLAWAEAAQNAAKERKLGLKVARIVQPLGRKAEEDEFCDVDQQWEKVKGIKKGGAILVRPDGMVAWRSIGPGDTAEIGKALANILGK